MSDRRKLLAVLGIATAIAACGQTGRLYLPGTAGEVTTRSTQTPAPATEPPPAAAPDEKDEQANKNQAPAPQKN